MNYFINNVKINNLFHLKGFNIPIENGNTPHLLLTGKNGTGKTVLLKAIAKFLDGLFSESNTMSIYNPYNFSLDDIGLTRV